MSHPVELRFFHVLALSELTLQLDQSSHRQSQTKSKDLKTNCNLKKKQVRGSNNDSATTVCEARFLGITISNLVRCFPLFQSVRCLRGARIDCIIVSSFCFYLPFIFLFAGKRRSFLRRLRRRLNSNHGFDVFEHCKLIFCFLGAVNFADKSDDATAALPRQTVPHHSVKIPEEGGTGRAGGHCQ